jgi:hypothetical protein
MEDQLGTMWRGGKGGRRVVGGPDAAWERKSGARGRINDFHTFGYGLP